MNSLLLNIVLAIAWMAVTGDFSAWNLVLGFVLGMGVLFAAGYSAGSVGYANRFGKALMLALFFIYALIVANLRVARDVLKPAINIRPAILAVPLDARSDAEITILAGLVTSTPGTTSMDVSEDRRILYVHIIDVDPGAVEEARRQIKQGFERRVLEVTR